MGSPFCPLCSRQDHGAVTPWLAPALGRRAGGTHPRAGSTAPRVLTTYTCPPSAATAPAAPPGEASGSDGGARTGALGRAVAFDGARIRCRLVARRPLELLAQAGQDDPQPEVEVLLEVDDLLAAVHDDAAEQDLRLPRCRSGAPLGLPRARLELPSHLELALHVAEEHLVCKGRRPRVEPGLEEDVDHGAREPLAARE